MDGQYQPGGEEWTAGETVAAAESNDAGSGSPNDLKIQHDCLDMFASTDFIMEPVIYDTIKTYFMHGGEPSPVVSLLSDNYVGIAQTVNLLAEWLIVAGLSVQEVQLLVENHLKSLIVKNFDPKKADTIFTLEGGVPSWLTGIISLLLYDSTI